MSYSIHFVKFYNSFNVFKSNGDKYLNKIRTNKLLSKIHSIILRYFKREEYGNSLRYLRSKRGLQKLSLSALFPISKNYYNDILEGFVINV